MDSGSNNNNQQQIEETPSNTLFVSGLHADMTDAQFSSLFSGCEGVQGTRTRYDRNDKLVGFVDFDNDDNAIAVREAFDAGNFKPLSNGGYSVHYARPTRNRSNDNSNNNNNNGGQNFGRRGSNNNNNNNNNGGQRRNQGGYDNNNNNYNRGGGRNQGGGGNMYGYSSMPYGGPYSGMGGAGNTTLPDDASNTLYVEGVASDATEREISHIFRPFPGFQSVRTFQRESRKVPGSPYMLCFVEFDNKHLATNAMQMLQGYKFDLREDRSRDPNEPPRPPRGLRISYAANSNKPRGERRGGNGDQQED